MSGDWLGGLRFDEAGLLPVVAQDAATGEVLMVAYANREAVDRTLAEGRAWFFSRSRGSLWLKGETSGNVLDVDEVRYDCDADTLLYRVRPRGPACHTGERTCFYRSGWRAEGAPAAGGTAAAGAAVLTELYQLILARKADPPQGSYVARLLGEGRDRILQKVGEEAVEVVLAGKNEDCGRLVSELADLLFHLSVLLGERELPWEEVFAELRRRRR